MTIITLFYVFFFYVFFFCYSITKKKTSYDRGLILRLLIMGLLYSLFFLGSTILTLKGGSVEYTIGSLGSLGLIFNITRYKLILQFITLTFFIVRLIISIRRKNMGYSLFRSSIVKCLIKIIDFSYIPLFGPLMEYVLWFFFGFNDICIIHLSQDELDKLHKDMHHALDTLSNSLDHLEKVSKDVDLVSTKEGALAMDVRNDSKLSDEEINKLSTRVGISESVYNTKIEEYKNLSKLDKEHNNSKNSVILDKALASIQRRYKDVIRDE